MSDDSNEAAASSSSLSPTRARPSNSYRPRAHLSFPQAAQPHLVRAAQKDLYYLSTLQSQFHEVARGILGSRALHTHADLIAAGAKLAYFVVATMGGAQTLGEEYVNAVLAGPNGKVVTRKRRLLFISLHILLPLLSVQIYTFLSQLLARLQAQRQAALHRARLRAQATRSQSAPLPSLTDRAISLASKALPTDGLQKTRDWLAWIASAHLAIFYITGKYHSVGQRVAKVQYISTIPRRPGSRPPSYEVLGVLLGIQIGVKSLISLLKWRRERREASLRSGHEEAHGGGGGASSSSSAAGTTTNDQLVRLDETSWSHASVPAKRTDISIQAGGAAAVVLPLGSAYGAEGQGEEGDAQVGDGDGQADEPRGSSVPLVYPDPDALPSASSLGLASSADRSTLDALRAAARGKAAELESVSQGIRRCTLCMESRAPQKGSSAVTECGHVFCWVCILGWLREKPECPLCRQHLNPSHVLPIYNF
ncbi:Predicted E3 ubiquitin ligase, integral peroxisomal membrane protein [Ceraceosorus bombacis]|uniref:RING-type E3 ubiquitin transferase n=1 Tax=Ceraceosorus bombacis TaxID=401625 RepID=A0A0P1BR96_9BASI|nr:Predicted E3 ubiquitin ligase, integral peroxisomal membrane protein [Ceraceosorus bombacis]